MPETIDPWFGVLREQFLKSHPQQQDEENAPEMRFTPGERIIFLEDVAPDPFSSKLDLKRGWARRPYFGRAARARVGAGVAVEGSKLPSRTINTPTAQATDGFLPALVAVGLGLDLKNTALPRPVPVRIRLDSLDFESVYLLEYAVRSFTEPLGFVLWQAQDPIVRSYERRFLYGTKEPKTEDEGKSHLELIGIVIENAAVGKDAAEIHKMLAEAKKINAEANKLNAEAGRTWAEAAEKFIKSILRLRVGFAILIGAVLIRGDGKDIVVKLLNPAEIFHTWINSLDSERIEPATTPREIRVDIVDQQGKKHQTVIPVHPKTDDTNNKEPD